MRIIVQKFGGTSLAEEGGRAAALEKVAAAHDAGYRPVVVVSAMGRQGDPYATDTLLGLISASAAEPREVGLLAACGEVISSVVMANALRRKGLDAVALTGGQAGIRTDDAYTDARILRVDLGRLRHHLREEQIPVVAGFQGATADGETTTLGRGGSDTTATALAAALGAEQVEIYTDVPGIMTADPRIVQDAALRPVITYEEVAQMAREGAQVIHPRAVDIAMRYGVPVHVRSTFEVGAGSLVVGDGDGGAPSAEIQDARPVTGITQIKDRYQLVVATPAAEAELKQREPEIFRLLADAEISVDMINVFPDRKSFIVAGELGEKAQGLLEEAGFPVEGRPGCARISVVGMGMHGRPGVMASIAAALHEEGVEILSSVDSHLTISCLVKGEAMERAVQALHRRFGLGEEEPPEPVPARQLTNHARAISSGAPSRDDGSGAAVRDAAGEADVPAPPAKGGADAVGQETERP